MRIFPFLLVSFLITAQSASAQAPVNYFSEFDFSKGDWELYGIQDWEYEPHKEEQFLIYDSLGSFYTDDLAVLQQIKEYLEPLSKDPRGYAAAYYLELYKNDTLQKGVSVNMDHDFVEIYKAGRYGIAPNLIKNLVGKVKKIPMTEYVFPTLEEARKGYELLIKIDTVLIKHQDPYDWDWVTYDGVAKILYMDNNFSASPEAEARRTIKYDYPAEKFLLKSAGGSYELSKRDEYYFWLLCNERLGTSIKTHKVITPWTKFSSIKLLVYGMTKEQVEELMKE